MSEVVCDIGDCPKTDNVSNVQICKGCPFNDGSTIENGSTIVSCTFEDNTN